LPNVVLLSAQMPLVCKPDIFQDMQIYNTACDALPDKGLPSLEIYIESSMPPRARLGSISWID
jgi:hypothetical protein